MVNKTMSNLQKVTTVSNLKEVTTVSNSDVLLVETSTETLKVTKGNLLKEVNEELNAKSDANHTHDEYVTESELNSKGLATEMFVTNKIAEAQLGNDGGNMDLSGYATTEYVDQEVGKTNAQLSQSINYVTYEMFGAKCNGVFDDGVAIKNAHDYANANGLPIKADGSKTYYIKSCDDILVKTNVDWNGATFIIDDTLSNVNRKNPIFRITSDKHVIELNSPFNFSLTKSTSKIDEFGGHGDVFVEVINTNKRQFIRRGANGDKGDYQRDYLIVDNQGNIITDINWDFDEITHINLYPIDEELLTVRNAHFTTICNDKELEYNYFERGIIIERDNVTISNISHSLQNEVAGSPYNGFIHAIKCFNFKLKSCKLSPRKCYENSAGTTMGTYGIRLDKVVKANISDIDGMSVDFNRWGIFTSNYCKDLVVDKSSLNRIDAHCGITNLKVLDSEIGNQGIRVVGQGELIVERTKFIGCSNLLTLRNDYGSSWNGRVSYKDIRFKVGKIQYTPKLIDYSNDGTHDFGYECFYPKVYFENIDIDDTSVASSDYSFMYLLQNTPEKTGDVTDASYSNPYYTMEEMVFRNIKTKSGKGFKFSYHPKNLVSKNQGTYRILEQCPNDTENILKRIQIQTNLDVIIDNVELAQFSKIYFTSSHIYHDLTNVVINDDYYASQNRIIPKFKIINCRNLRATVGATVCELYLQDCNISQLVCTSGGSMMRGGATNCVIRPEFEKVMTCVKVNYMDFLFLNCIFDEPSIKDVNSLSRDELWTIYSFLYYFKSLNNKVIHARCHMLNCKLHHSIDLSIIEPRIDDFDFKFENFNFQYYIAHRGYRGEMPQKNEGYTIPIGMNYWITTESKFATWNGNEWI